MSFLVLFLLTLASFLATDARQNRAPGHAHVVTNHLQALESMVKPRQPFDKINVKIGVMVPEERRHNEFWVEFDPTVPMLKESNRVILPFGAVPHVRHDESTGDAHLPFYVHRMPGCSSFLLPLTSHEQSTDEVFEYEQRGLARCQKSLSGPSSGWRYWSLDNLTRDAYESAFPTLIESCRLCAALSNVTSVRLFPVVELKQVVDILGQVDFLDIDAQGLDVALLLSLKQTVLNIKKVQLECQSVDTAHDFLYYRWFNGHKIVSNDCNVAHEYLESNGFRCEHQINNCACSEYNLICVRGVE